MSELKLKAEQLVRVYCDIDYEADLKIKFRCLQLRQQLGKRITRKEYLEKLISDDLSKVKGATLHELSKRTNR